MTETQRYQLAEQRRVRREAKIAELRKRRATDEIQAAVERGKEKQRQHRLAPATPWKERIQTWLDTPVPDDIGETLDRLSEIYNAQQQEHAGTPD